MGWFWRGKVLMALGKNKEALDAWKKGGQSADGSVKQNEYKRLCFSML